MPVTVIVNGVDYGHPYKAVKNNPDNYDVVFASVKEIGHALNWASDRLKADKDIVLEAIYSTPMAFAAAHPTLRTDSELVELVLQKTPQILCHMPEQITSNKDMISHAIFHHGYALTWASEDLKEDKYLVEKAFKNMKYLDEGYDVQDKTIQDIYIAASKKNIDALSYASDALKDDSKIVFEALGSIKLLSKNSIQEYEPNPVKSMWLDAIYNSNAIREERQKPVLTNCRNIEELQKRLIEKKEQQENISKQPILPKDIHKICSLHAIKEDKMIDALVWGKNYETGKYVDKYLSDSKAYKKEVSENSQYKEYFQISSEEKSLLDNEISKEKNEKLNQQQDKLDQQQALLLQLTSIIKELDPSLLKQFDSTLLSSCMDISSSSYDCSEKALGKTSESPEELVVMS